MGSRPVGYLQGWPRSWTRHEPSTTPAGGQSGIIWTRVTALKSSALTHSANLPPQWRHFSIEWKLGRYWRKSAEKYGNKAFTCNDPLSPSLGKSCISNVQGSVTPERTLSRIQKITFPVAFSICSSHVFGHFIESLKFEKKLNQLN